MPPRYKLYSEDQLGHLEQETTKQIRKRLQIPPYLEFKPEPIEVLSRDPQIQGYLEHRVIFIDITKGAPREDRVMVVREMDGTLRTPSREERDRTLQIFYPRRDKFMNTPRIFKGDLFDDMLNKGHHLNLLERATVQFEPDTEDFIMITRKVYEHIQKTQQFEKVESTRFFGHMVYYFIVQKQIDRLLVHLIKQDLVDNAADIVRLYDIVHPDSKSATAVTPQDSSTDVLNKFAKLELKDGGMIELGVQNYLARSSSRASETSAT